MCVIYLIIIYTTFTARVHRRIYNIYCTMYTLAYDGLLVHTLTNEIFRHVFTRIIHMSLSFVVHDELRMISTYRLHKQI